MKILVAMPIGCYHGFLGRCLLASSEYAILKNGLITHDPEDSLEGTTVELLCELEHVKMILNHANLVYSPAVPYIEKSLTLPHQTERDSQLQRIRSAFSQTDPPPAPTRTAVASDESAALGDSAKKRSTKLKI